LRAWRSVIFGGGEPVGLNGELELHRRLPWRCPVRLVLMWSMAKASVDDPWRAFAEEEAGGRELNAMPRYRAEDLIYEAWEVTGPRRTKLARQALELWPDCADAYVVLAQAASDLDGARELLEEGVTAGVRALGSRVFEDDADEFWLIFETRPYMRARASLAAVLWRLGRREEAVAHQRELLRLNPRDNQGLRYRQANWLLQLRSYDELDRLFADHAGDGHAPGFVYTKALAAFARRGARVRAQELLAEARSLNPHIPAYLTGRQQLPKLRPEYTVFGEESEAVDYAAGAGELWAGVPGALAWLES
jgi:tetratricopeptide (TPR) repeat protein